LQLKHEIAAKIEGIRKKEDDEIPREDFRQLEQRCDCHI
jgi:hypothetical protein